MNTALLQQLAALPRLDPANRQSLPCKVCGHRAYVFDIVDFNKMCSPTEIYPFGASGVVVPYYCCSLCSFIFTPFFDDWTGADFARFVYNEDYTKVDGEYSEIRPEREAARVAKHLALFPQLRILDFGSGSGVFATNLKSKGFECVAAYDPYSSPARPAGSFDLITCFEVLEHTTSPRSCLADIAGFLAPGGCILFTTGIQPADIGVVRANWWYVGPRNGHVSIYSLSTLARLGPESGMSLYAGPGGLAFADLNPSAITQTILSRVGKPVRFFQLMSPATGATIPMEQRGSWHGLEGLNADSGEFRWTTGTDIVWRLQTPLLEPGDLIVWIPIRHEIQPGFADRCRLEVGKVSAPVIRRAGALTASLTVEEPVEAVIKLVTPPLLRPCDLRPVSDARALGLAISAGPQHL